MSTPNAHAEILPRLSGTGRGERLFDQVVEMLAMGIVTERYPPGSVLPNEAALDVAVSVSRSAYREALKFLTSKGLIEAKPKFGTRVRPRSDWNLLDPDILRWSLQAGPSASFARDLFELRRAIEPEGARLAAMRRSEGDIERIEDAMARMERHAPMSTPSILADLDFHERILDASGNHALGCLKNVIAATILWSQNVKQAIGTAEFIASLKDHRRILDAIRLRDGDLAAARMTLLVADALESTTAAIEAGRRGAAPGTAEPQPRKARARSA